MSARTVLKAAIIGAALGSFASNAQAEVIQLSPASFHSPSADHVDIRNGELLTYHGPVVANLDFPDDAGNICRLTLIYRDGAADFGVEAALYRKRSDHQANPAVPLSRIASITTAGVSPSVRTATTRAIQPRAINTSNSFYWVEVHTNTQDYVGPLSLIGVQIEYKPTCP